MPTSLTDSYDFSLRDRATVIVGLSALAGAAWAYMLYGVWTNPVSSMQTMWMPPTGSGAWSTEDFCLVFLMWAIMMIAMMVPSIAPMVIIFSGLNRKRRRLKQSHVPTVVLVAGYLTAWIAFSILATILQWPLHAYSLLTPMMNNDSGYLAGSVLLIAGIYQWTPWNDACLQQCRTPLGFLMTEWRSGVFGALVMGFRHGIYCVGCCWALMLVLFAVGVMNLLWILVIAGFVLIEKLVPLKLNAFRILSGLLLFGWGCSFFIGVQSST